MKPLSNSAHFILSDRLPLFDLASTTWKLRRKSRDAQSATSFQSLTHVFVSGFQFKRNHISRLHTLVAETVGGASSAFRLRVNLLFSTRAVNAAQPGKRHKLPVFFHYTRPAFRFKFPIRKSPRPFPINKTSPKNLLPKPLPASSPLTSSVFIRVHQWFQSLCLCVCVCL